MDSCPPVKIAYEAGAAACGTNVLGLSGCPNRTFVLLFPMCHLNVSLPRKPTGMRLGERLGEDRGIERSNEIHFNDNGLVAKSVAFKPSSDKNPFPCKRLYIKPAFRVLCSRAKYPESANLGRMRSIEGHRETRTPPNRLTC
jgi:hypothetical protein